MHKTKMRQVCNSVVRALTRNGYEPLLLPGQFLVWMPINEVAQVIISIVPYLQRSGDIGVNPILGLRFPLLQGLVQGFRDGTCEQVETDPTWAILTSRSCAPWPDVERTWRFPVHDVVDQALVAYVSDSICAALPLCKACASYEGILSISTAVQTIWHRPDNDALAIAHLLLGDTDAAVRIAETERLRTNDNMAAGLSGNDASCRSFNNCVANWIARR